MELLEVKYLLNINWLTSTKPVYFQIAIASVELGHNKLDATSDLLDFVVIFSLRFQII